MKPIAISAIIFFAVITSLTARAEMAATNIFYLRAQTNFSQARQVFQSSTNAESAWRFGRACFEFARLATNDAQRAVVARTGIDACQRAIQLQPNSAAATYFLAENLGALAQALAPSLKAYRLVYDVEREFLKAAELDAHWDHAGPARSLGELYDRAPGWPLSVGSKHKAREWFEAAVSLEPDYPGNQLDLAEARLKWREQEALAASLKKIEDIWPAAQSKFTGEAWEETWVDWNRRRAALRASYRQIYGAPP